MLFCFLLYFYSAPQDFVVWGFFCAHVSRVLLGRLLVLKSSASPGNWRYTWRYLWVCFSLSSPFEHMSIFVATIVVVV